jgi:hypothetical protein
MRSFSDKEGLEMFVYDIISDGEFELIINDYEIPYNIRGQANEYLRSYSALKDKTKRLYKAVVLWAAEQNLIGDEPNE